MYTRGYRQICRGCGLAEYKRHVAVAVTVGVMLAAFVGVLALTTAPVNVTTALSQSSSSNTNSASRTSTGASQLFRVEFQQESRCPYGVWLVPWGVMMDNQTVVQPSNATLPLAYSATHLSYNSTYSTIWFSVPEGTYGYSILPNDSYGQGQQGNVTVDGSNILVQVTAFFTEMGCSSTTTIAGTTVTVTQTLTTTASQATTTYIPPTSNCIILPITVTTTTTVTVESPPATSTTTTTVTTTSTSYTQTDTVTSCTYSEQTVTSTITTTSTG
jgi:hypothetical protein